MLTLFKAGVTIWLSDTVDSRVKNNIMDKEGHSVTIKGPIHQEHIIIPNAPDRSSKNSK